MLTSDRTAEGMALLQDDARAKLLRIADDLVRSMMPRYGQLFQRERMRFNWERGTGRVGRMSKRRLKIALARVPEWKACPI